MADRLAAGLCACRCNIPLPATMAELLAAGGLAVDLGLGDLALLATCFDDALVITLNAGALVEGRGGYGPLPRGADRSRLGLPRACVRIQDWQDLPVLITRAGTDPAALSVIGGEGRVQHRISLRGADWDKARRLPLSAPPQPITPVAGGRNVISLAAVRARRAGWGSCDSADQIEDVMRDGGRGRLDALPAIGPAARRLRASLLGSFLHFLGDRKSAMQFTVPTQGIAQSLSGTVQNVQSMGPVLIGHSTTGRFALDQSEIAQVWATRHGSHATLEVYGHDGDCVALLGGVVDGCRQWASYIEAFPSHQRLGRGSGIGAQGPAQP